MKHGFEISKSLLIFLCNVPFRKNRESLFKLIGTLAEFALRFDNRSLAYICKRVFVIFCDCLIVFYNCLVQLPGEC